MSFAQAVAALKDAAAADARCRTSRDDMQLRKECYELYGHAEELLSAALQSTEVEERVKQPLRSKQALVKKRIAALSTELDQQSTATAPDAQETPLPSPARDFFKESVAALKEAAAVDARLKRAPSDAGLLRQAVERYGTAVELLQGAVDPGNAKVSAK
eukprot:SAG31_NODE_8460_length_1446_cov_3.505568_2_plen_158_part_01